MTHGELVQRAERWLRNTIRCPVVLTEAIGGGSEIPDAVGWTGVYHPESYLIECKASRSDFLADRKKMFRLEPGLGVGRFRYFMAPAGLISPDELPPRWGLLEVHLKTVRTRRKAKRFAWDHQSYLRGYQAEMGLLLSELHKIQIVQRGGSLTPSKSGRRIMAMLAGRMDGDV